jgi:hypothetical protein
MYKFIEANVEQYIQEVAKKGKKQVKVLFSTEKNIPKSKGRFDLHMEDGSQFAFGTWSQFITVVYDLSRQGRKIHFGKTWEVFKKKHAPDIDKNMMVQYESDGREDLEFNLDEIKEKSVDLKAAPFKEWLTMYMAQFPELEYEVDEYKGVAKLIKDIEAILDNRDLPPKFVVEVLEALEDELVPYETHIFPVPTTVEQYIQRVYGSQKES